MAIQSGFFNSINGDRRYDAKWFAQYFATFIGNGVFPQPSSGLQVMADTQMRTIVKAGKGWINGYFIINDSDYILTHDRADGVLKRIDRVVMRLDHQDRLINILIKKGAFASQPVAPSLQRDGDAYELALADVLINNGATQITQAHITDQRLNKALCGIVHGLVEQVDTTTIFNQYQAWLEEYKGINAAEWEAWQNQEKADFEAWLDSIKDLLDDNVAAKLAAQITAVDAKVGDTANLKTQNKTNVVSAINELFTNANNLKKDWADVVGAPLNPNDTSAQLKDKTQTIKNTLATNLTEKGQVANGSETLDNLARKVKNISTGIEIDAGDKEMIGSEVVFSQHGSVLGDYVKFKEIRTGFTAVIRVAYKFRLNGTGQATAQVRVNNVSVHSKFVNNNSWLTIKFDTPVRDGDLIQLYFKRNDGSPHSFSVECQSLIIYTDFNRGDILL